jgi:superfamily II DNA or RNA helicase
MIKVERAAKNNCCRLKLIPDTHEELDQVRSLFMIKNDKARFSTHATDFYCPITLGGSFKSGLLFKIVTKTVQNFPEIKFDIPKDIIEIVRPISITDEIPKAKYEYRDYQEKAIKQSLKFGRGIILLPTSAGKSLICYGICKTLIDRNYKILILVPNIQLVSQLNNDFIEYGIKENIVKMFSSFSLDPIQNSNKIIIANRQWLQTHNKELPTDINAIIVDEVHQIKKDSKVEGFVEKFDCKIKIGLTGTLPDDEINQLNIMGIFGSILIEKTPYELQDRNILAKTNIIPIRFEHNPIPRFSRATIEDIQQGFYFEWSWIEENEKSNIKICKIAEKLNGNTLILFDHVEHGKKLFELITEESKQKFLVFGETELDHREDIKKIMEQAHNIITIANVKCFGTGISIKNIQNIIFAMSGKGTTKIIQAIGRGLRTTERKTTLNLIDIYHNLRYSDKHFNVRIELYKKYYQKDVSDKIKQVPI